MVVKRNRATRNHCHEALREFLNSRFISVWVEGRGGVPGRYRRLWYHDVSTARNRVSTEIKPRSVSSVPVISSPPALRFQPGGKYSAAKRQEQTEARESVLKGNSLLTGNFTGNFCIFLNSERRFHSKNPLCCSHFSDNSLRKLTGKIFRGTGIFSAVTGNSSGKVYPSRDAARIHRNNRNKNSGCSLTTLARCCRDRLQA
jgi:hypothetical protein